MLSPRRRGGDRQHRPGLVDDGQRSLAELLPWLCLHGPQRVLCKEGSLLACFEMAGLDADSLDVDEANHVSARVELALRGLDERITLWSIFQRRRSHAYPRASFDHPVAHRIDALHGARFRAGEQFVNSHVLALLFSPDSQTRAWDGLLGLLRRRRVRPAAGMRAPMQPGRAWTWGGGLDGEARAERVWSELAAQARTFEALLEAFVAALHGLGVRRLADAELLGFLNTCASPTRTPGPVRPPGSALFLDAALGEDCLRVGAEQLRFVGSAGARVVAALGIKAWPEATVPGLIESLLRVPQQLSVVQVFRVVDGDSAKRHIQSVQRFHLNLRRSAFSFLREAVLGEAGEVVDDTRAMAAAEAREALAALGSQRQVYGWFNLSVLVSVAPGEDLDSALRACAVAVREAGFLVMREGLHLLSAWTGALPGQWGQLVRWHFIHNGNVADLMPLQMPGLGGRMNSWLGEQLGAPCTALTCLPGLDRTTFHFNFHHGDLGHCLLLGPSRAGKSMLANFLLSQFQRYPRARIVIFDKDRSCRIPTLLQGGVWLDPGAAGGQGCNPVAAISQPGGRAWLHAWLRELLTLHGCAWGAGEEAALAAAVEALAILPAAQHRLATVQALLPAALAAELAPWVGDGVNAKLFDSASDGLALGALCCIEMGELLRDPALARLFMAHAVRRIDALLAEVPLAPTVIYVEEAWFMLAEPGFRERLRDWLKTLPKRLALVLMATQSLDDLTASPVFQSLADNVPTRIFLANRNAPQQAALYMGQFGLNPAQLQRIACAEPKRQFLVVRPGQSRFIDLSMPLETVQLLRSDRRAQAVFDAVLRAQCSSPSGLDSLAVAYLAALERDDARA